MSGMLGCIDSKIPAEMVFNQGIGNMFVASVAGNVEDAYILGGLNMQLKLRAQNFNVVFGRNKCGAANDTRTWVHPKFFIT